MDTLGPLVRPPQSKRFSKFLGHMIENHQSHRESAQYGSYAKGGLHGTDASSRLVTCMPLGAVATNLAVLVVALVCCCNV